LTIIVIAFGAVFINIGNPSFRVILIISRNNVLVSTAELQIGDTDKPLKLMSSWKQLLTKYSSDKGHGSHGNSSLENVPTFHLRRNLFFPTTKEKLVKSS
jgi:hypothetical protein